MKRIVLKDVSVKRIRSTHIPVERIQPADFAAAIGGKLCGKLGDIGPIPLGEIALSKSLESGIIPFRVDH